MATSRIQDSELEYLNTLSGGQLQSLGIISLKSKALCRECGTFGELWRQYAGNHEWLLLCPEDLNVVAQVPTSQVFEIRDSPFIEEAPLGPVKCKPSE